MAAFHITVINLFFIWRILFGPLSYPALVSFQYLVLSEMVSYMNLATAGGLVQLGLMASFERVVAVREGLVMAGVAVGCISTTTVHLLLEAISRHKLGLLHLGQLPGYIWLSGGKIDPNTAGIGSLHLLIPHLVLLLLTKLAVTACQLLDRFHCPRTLVTRYRLSLATSGANGKLTWSAINVLAFVVLGKVAIVPLNPTIFNQLDPADSNTLPFRSILGITFAFWVGCGSFLADPEPRQFVLRRLCRAWAGWRAGREAGCRRERMRRGRGRVTDVGGDDRVRANSASQSTMPHALTFGGTEEFNTVSHVVQTQVNEAEIHYRPQPGDGRSQVLGAGQPAGWRLIEVREADFAIELT